MGVAPLPGSFQFLDRIDGLLTVCDAATCPYSSVATVTELSASAPSSAPPQQHQNVRHVSRAPYSAQLLPAFNVTPGVYAAAGVASFLADFTHGLLQAASARDGLLAALGDDLAVAALTGGSSGSSGGNNVSSCSSGVDVSSLLAAWGALTLMDDSDSVSYLGALQSLQGGGPAAAGGRVSPASEGDRLANLAPVLLLPTADAYLASLDAALPAFLMGNVSSTELVSGLLDRWGAAGGRAGFTGGVCE